MIMEKNKNVFPLDRKDIKLNAQAEAYFYDKNNITCQVVYELNMPTLLTRLVGQIFGRSKATAFCDAEDTYDETIGKKIALAKAESRAYAAAKKELIKRIESIEDAIYTVEPILTAFADKADACIEHNTEYINTVSNGTANQKA